MARTVLAGSAVLLGSAASAALFVSGAAPGVVLVPLSLALLVALAVLPFPAADYALALGLLGTLPLLPPSGLPNFPLAAAVVGVALARIVIEQRARPPLRATVAVAGVWALVGIGALISHWPPAAVWLRPAGVLALGFVAALLGLAVWVDPQRRWRWITALVAATLVISISALVIFAAQYVARPDAIVAALVSSQGYLRGDAAATAFDAMNNWAIAGTPLILRALSPLLPSPLSLGAYLGVGIPLAAALMLNTTAPRATRKMAVAALALSTTALVVTYSRSSWVAAAAALAAVAIVALLAWRRARSPGDRPARGLLPGREALATAGAVVVLGGTLGLAGIVTTSNELAWERIVAASEDHSVIERIEGDAVAVARIRSDLLRGMGLGNWTGTADSDPPAAGEHVPYVHNLYLEYAGATGILGGLWVVLLLGTTVVGGAAGAIRARTRESVPAGLALVAIGAFGATQGMFDDVFLNPQICWLVAWSFGGGVAMLRTGR